IVMSSRSMNTPVPTAASVHHLRAGSVPIAVLLPSVPFMSSPFHVGSNPGTRGDEPLRHVTDGSAVSSRVREQTKGVGMRVFVAGAGGIVGRHLVPELVARGHQVVATTRNPARQEALRSLGATPAVMDGLDPASVGEAVARAEPEVIVHEMTALASFRSPRSFDREFAVTNELRTTGTDNLIAAAGAVGVRRIVAQSYTGWPNERTGGPVKTEEDPLDTDPPARQRRSLEAIVHLERVVLAAAPVEGLAVRYGALYGPGTSAEEFGRLLLARKFPLVGGGGGRAGGRARRTRPLQHRRRPPRARPRVAALPGRVRRRAAAAPPAAVARTARDRRDRRLLDDADPGLVEREGEARARVDTGLEQLAGGVPRRRCGPDAPARRL